MLISVSAANGSTDRGAGPRVPGLRFERWRLPARTIAFRPVRNRGRFQVRFRRSPQPVCPSPDKSFMVYFEWDGPPGAHVLSGLWKAPDGRVVQVSPDVKIESKTTELTCYWTYTIDPQTMPGVWSLEVRIDGQPAGSHNFEI